MKNILFVWIVTSLSCLAADTNINYADLPREIANEYMFGMVLSGETNSLKSGVWMDNASHVIVVRNGEVVGRAAPVMLNMSTNKIHFWYFWPSTDLNYQIKLIDDRGNEVSKTAYGERFGRPPKQNIDNLDVLGAHDPRSYGLDNTAIMPQGDILDEFDYNPVKSLPKCFEIEKAGNYKFTLIHKVYVTEQRTNGLFLKPITFSPVTVDVVVQTNSPAK